MVQDKISGLFKSDQMLRLYPFQLQDIICQFLSGFQLFFAVTLQYGSSALYHQVRFSCPYGPSAIYCIPYNI